MTVTREEMLAKALDAASFYINASDRELQDAGMSRQDALGRFHELHGEVSPDGGPLYTRLQSEAARPAFDAKTNLDEVMRQIREQHSISETMRGAASDALVRQAPARPDTAEELAKALERIIAWENRSPTTGLLLSSVPPGIEKFAREALTLYRTANQEREVPVPAAYMKVELETEPRPSPGPEPAGGAMLNLATELGWWRLTFAEEFLKDLEADFGTTAIQAHETFCALLNFYRAHQPALTTDHTQQGK